ncbi:MAG: transglycosylase SLT domain-containing protein [Nitrospinota bacterium]
MEGEDHHHAHRVRLQSQGRIPNPRVRADAACPRSGAHDAYLHLYGKKRILRSSYLYNPGNNIRLGTTYFMLVKRNYLKNVQREPHNTYLAIASYNWGISNIRRRILRRYNMQTLDGDQLLQIIDQRAPDETRN